ncbi:MAG: DUF1501 domain-containing protein [Bacteroidales bacterium]|nr:DUF1501 domain-containing protein [Bacteroidales bacterium]MBN2819133.1 DUF1501 domain-containing protein [Bacteroidales bacterium]
MNRRKFIRNISLSGTGAVMLGGVPVKLLANNEAFKLAAGAGDSDNILIFIQLHGGNDALNTLVPVAQYSEYYNLRPNIALPSNGTRSFINVDTRLNEDLQVGLHPDMLGFKELYDAGMASIVQNVGYPDMNGSHFRGRDIVLMGGDAYSDYSSGWMGRFLDYEYDGYPENFPNDNMPDPIGLEMSGSLSLAFHREDGIPIGLNIGSPDAFYQLITSVGVEPPIAFPDSHAGDELKYIMEFEKKSNEYAGRLKEVYDAGSNSSTDYPESYPYAAPISAARNPLAPQLKLIARLLKGGIKTRIFLCRIGGFDTHGDQVEKSDPTLGAHSALLYHVSSAVKAFYDDLENLGLADKVLSMTFTEFGRRAYSNASYGTDHGTSTPVFLFGKGLNGGIYGENPDLSNLKGGNLIYNIDYRQIYTSVVQDWFGASDEAMIATGFDSWVGDKLPLMGTSGIDQNPYLNNAKSLKLFPNPVQSDLSAEFFLRQNSNYEMKIFNVEGKEVMSQSGFGLYGVNNQLINTSSLVAGKYVILIKTKNALFKESFIKL